MGIKGELRSGAGCHAMRKPFAGIGTDKVPFAFSFLSCAGLTSLIQDVAPDAIKEHDIKSFFGRKVAIDASMSLYQFLIAVRQNDGQQLMSESGETTR